MLKLFLVTQFLGHQTMWMGGRCGEVGATPVHICPVHMKHPHIIAKTCLAGKSPSLLGSGVDMCRQGR